MMYRGLLVLGALFLSVTLYAEVAIIPYRIDNPSTYLPETTGGEYARLLAIAVQLKKRGVDITPARDVDLDLQRSRIDAQRTITSDDLNHLGRTRHIDFFLLGSLGKSENGYTAESILYSVKQGRAVTRIKVRAASLLQLAEREIQQAFADYRDQSARSQAAVLDAVFVIDTSYSMNSDMAQIRQAVGAIAAECIDVRRIDARFTIIPYSDRITSRERLAAAASLVSLKADLERLKPAGGATGEHLVQAVQLAVANVRWRPEAVKLIVVIANSPLERARNLEKYALMAKRKGIPITTIALGSLTGEQTANLGQLSEISGGMRLSAAYRQRVFDADARAIDLYMEQGRLFNARGEGAGWREGLMSGARRGGRNKPLDFLSEVFFDSGRHAVTPYSMAKKYGEISRERIINTGDLESNLETLARRLVTERLSSVRGDTPRPVGKVLLADGMISMWVPITDERQLAYFISKKGSGFTMPLAVTIRRDPESTHGITLVPRLTGILDDAVPSMLKASLESIVKNPDQYLSKGLLAPPVWFVTVRVEEAESYQVRRDIRD